MRNGTPDGLLVKWTPEIEPEGAQRVYAFAAAALERLVAQVRNQTLSEEQRRAVEKLGRTLRESKGSNNNE